MALPKNYTIAINRIPDLFEKIRDGQAPEQFSQQILKDWGFSSSNDRSFLPLLKTLGFLSPDGKPTSMYNEYRDHSRSKTIMAQALRAAYKDIFLIKEYPTDADKKAVEGKFKSYHNVSDHVAKLMTRTFYGLLKLADLKHIAKKPKPGVKQQEKPAEQSKLPIQQEGEMQHKFHVSGLHYNFQIHLPATKDIEVYNAIFKSIKEHLIEG